MRKRIKYIGLDVHKDSIAISIADEGRNGEVRYYGEIMNDMNLLDKLLRKIISQYSKPCCVYEAGPCGYYIYRHLSEKGIDCCVVAPALIPKKSGDRIKTDRRDSMTLARLHRSGELTGVYVPNTEDEALRDLVRGRDDAKKAQRKAKQQLGAFFLRHNFVYSGKSKWSKAHFNWMADITMFHPAQQIVLQEYIDMIQTCGDRVDRMTDQISQLSKLSRQKDTINAYQSLRGVSLIVATTISSELGDLRRFERPEQLMAYIGLVPSEHSSGEKKKRGSITKAGNSHVRRALVEAAQTYRFPARKSRQILKRQEGIDDKIIQIAWKAQCRLCGRYRMLVAGGKKSNVAKTAVARELAGFIWAIAQEVPMAA
jgi:transposase